MAIGPMVKRKGETVLFFNSSKTKRILVITRVIIVILILALKVRRARHSDFCLVQKFVDLKSLSTKLQKVYAVFNAYANGFIHIEVDRQIDIIEACKGLCSIYSSRVAPVFKNEVSHLLSIQKSCNQVTEGMWARVKNGNYMGDLAQIVAVNDVRKRATVKLIPRIDLQALA